MMSTATDVTVGNNHPVFNNPAGPGYDLATGAGLVDANRAVLRARLACLTIRPPIRPIGPVQPIQPIQPVQPIQPIQPVQPIRPPVGPVQPIRPPVGPIGPIQPIRPPVGPPPIRPPVGPIQPIRPPVGPPPIVGLRESEENAAFEAQLAEAVQAMAAAGYGAEEIDQWLTAVLGGGDVGLTSEEAAALEQAILEGDEFDL